MGSDKPKCNAKHLPCLECNRQQTGRRFLLKAIICKVDYEIFKCETLPELKKLLSPQIPHKNGRTGTLMYKVMYSPNSIFKEAKKKGRKAGGQKGRKEEGNGRESREEKGEGG